MLVSQLPLNRGRPSLHVTSQRVSSHCLNQPVRSVQLGASVSRSLFFVLLGVALLVAGATLLVEGAVNIATTLGVSSLVVGLTVVAVGTSLPELATSIIAVRRGERDLVVVPREVVNARVR
ncbi:sodium:calcium antiporter [Flaviflexus salsibiostraticola]|uniref:sodium:calcium antiporter n=1 Tax=Flaviflexus salsibiostraticola TaxID=1282737 RepID=UPI003CCC83C3